MEVAGLGIGIAGLVGLFSSCLEAIDKVKDYKSSTFDPDALNVQFDAERLRLQHWGCNVGLELENGRLSTSHHERLNDNKLRSMVEDLLRIIHDILKSDERFDQSGNGKAGLSSNVASSRANQPRRTRERVARSRTSRVIWARGGGKGDRTAQVTQLGSLVQHLYNLVPPIESGHNATNGRVQCGGLTNRWFARQNLGARNAIRI